MGEKKLKTGGRCQLLLVRTTGTDLTIRRVSGSRILLRQTVAAVFVLELLGNRQRAECELLVNKTAVGETEAATATHPQREKERKKQN